MAVGTHQTPSGYHFKLYGKNARSMESVRLGQERACPSMPLGLGQARALSNALVLFLMTDIKTNTVAS